MSALSSLTGEAGLQTWPRIVPSPGTAMVQAQAGLGMLVGMAGGSGQGCSHNRLGRSRKWQRTSILTRFPSSDLGSGRAVGRAYAAIRPHELLSWHSRSDWHLWGIQASTAVGDFSMNTLRTWTWRQRTLSWQVPHLQRSFWEPHPSRQEGKTGSPTRQ